MLAEKDYGKPLETPLGSYLGSYNMLTLHDRFYSSGFYLQGPMMKTLKRRLLELEMELLIHRKKASDFEEEKLLNHVIYAVKELMEFLEKENGGGGSSRLC